MRCAAPVVFALSLVLVLGAGCSRSPSAGKRFVEKQMEGALNQGGGGHAKVDIGSSGNVDVSGLPEEFRQPGAVGIAHIGGGDTESQSDTYILQTGDPVAAVIAAYKQRMTGWKQVGIVETPNGTVLTYESPDGARHASVMVGSDGESGKTQINISVAGK
jgi:hypothetical protein